MEEERLLMLRECRDLREKCGDLTQENDDYKDKISLFERELEEVQDQVRQ